MKYTRFLLITCLVFGILILPYAVFADDVVSISDTINVARGKTVYCGAPEADGSLLTNGIENSGDNLGMDYSYPASGTMIELPGGVTASAATGLGDDWFIVDLGKKYNVEKIVLYATTKHGEIPRFIRYTKILASNNLTFEDASELGSTGSSHGNMTYEINLDGTNAYRYIKIQKTVAGEHRYKELEVYANETLAEVSRGMEVISNYTSDTWSAGNIVDGITDNDSDCWLVEGWYTPTKGPIPYAVVDLGKDIPVYMIQMYARRGIPGGAVPTSNWEIYGFEDGTDVIAEDFSPTDGTKLLAPTSAEFPCNLQANDPNNHYKASLDGSAYRYVVFQKTNYNVQLAEVRIFTAVPCANSAVMSGNKITVSFTDTMDESTIADGLSVTINGEVAEDIYFEMTDEYTLEIDLGKQYFDSQIKILLTDDIENDAGIGLKARAFTIFTPKALETTVEWQNSKTGEGTAIGSIADAVEAGQIGAKVSFANNSSTESASALLLAVLYDENNYIVSVDEKRITVDALDNDLAAIGFDLPQGINTDNAANYKFSLFLWKDYRLMKPLIPKVTLGE